MANPLTNRKFIHFNHLANFENLIQNLPGSILDTQIVFIKDARKIWTHGTYYTLDERITLDIYLKLQTLAGISADIIAKLDLAQLILAGPTVDRPVGTQQKPLPQGLAYLDTDLQREIWWNGTMWIDSEGNNADIPHFGDLSERPDPDDVKVGFHYSENEDTGQLYVSDEVKWIPEIILWTYLDDPYGTIDYILPVIHHGEHVHLTIDIVTESAPSRGSAYSLGEEVIYRIILSNDGSAIPITNIGLEAYINDKPINITGKYPTTLVDGQVSSFTVSHIVTEEDILRGEVVCECSSDNNADNLLNLVVAVEPAEDPESTVDPDPTLAVSVYTTSSPHNEKYELYEEITYNVTITNNGNLTVDNVTVLAAVNGEEEDITFLLNNKTTFAPRESVTFMYSHIVTEEDIVAGSVQFEVSVDGDNASEDPTDSGDDETEDPTVESRSSLTVSGSKTTSTPSGGFLAGDIVSFRVEVTNDGNMTINNFRLYCEETELDETIDSLAPRASKSFTDDYTITSEDATAGHVSLSWNTRGGYSLAGAEPSSIPATEYINVTLNR